MESAALWVEQLGLPQAPSAMARTFGEVLSLASELGAMDQNHLGAEDRPEDEVIARRSIETAFAGKVEELTRRLPAFDAALNSDVFELIDHLRTGDIDFAAEAQAAIGGASSNCAEAAGYLSLLLMSAEIDSISVEGQSSGHAQATSSEQAGDG